MPATCQTATEANQRKEILELLATGQRLATCLIETQRAYFAQQEKLEKLKADEMNFTAAAAEKGLALLRGRLFSQYQQLQELNTAIGAWFDTEFA